MYEILGSITKQNDVKYFASFLQNQYIKTIITLHRIKLKGEVETMQPFMKLKTLAGNKAAKNAFSGMKKIRSA